MDTKSQDGLNGSPGKVPQRKRTLSRKLSNIKLISYKKPKNKKFSLFKLKNPKFTKLKLSLEKLKNFKVKPKLLLQYRFACVVLLFALSALFIAAGINPTTSVIFNGELVGVVESPEIVREALKAAEAKASEILGYKYCISEGISYRRGVTAKNLDTIELSNAILEHLDCIEQLYVLTVNGEYIGGTENRKDIEDLLASILERNMSPTALSASFAESTAIKQVFVPKGSLHGLAEMRQILNTKNSDGKYILNIKTVEEVEYTAPLAYPVQYISDDTMYEGEYKVLNEGANGQIKVVERLTLLSGNEIDSVVSETDVLEEPVTAVIAVGTLPRHASKGYYIWPTDGVITSGFGYRDIGIGSSYHRGLDIGVPYMAPIYAADGGIVITSGYYGEYGNLVEILHDNGDITAYAHCTELYVSYGDKVAQGDIIAAAGDTGLSDGVHLHFEIHRWGVERVDPLDYLPPR
ncbi:MAG TPA: peptidoglycan DD-metalloendopeptidase family protein [Clostridiales bacterium]|jgi:murein DD-endopeptidase MepM/ murein hydrolase activator NlpD|nr:peptidoglycan DD-metalloendopeptidase family protein [Clostridiales bacterium]